MTSAFYIIDWLVLLLGYSGPAHMHACILLASISSSLALPVLRHLSCIDLEVLAVLQAIHEAYRSNADMALIVEDDMKVLRWPSHGLLYTAPPDWDILLLYMMGAQADSIYR
jgi:hypothetical protein